jgi:uncharacterized protein YbjT (DUF2867 family)
VLVVGGTGALGGQVVDALLGHPVSLTRDDVSPLRATAHSWAS